MVSTAPEMANLAFHAATRCPACASTAIGKAPSVRGFVFRRCRHCSTLFCVDGPKDDGSHGQLYLDGGYFQNPDFDSPETGGYHGYKQYFADRVQIEEKFDRVLVNIECLHTVGALLDVGAGPGFLLSAARARGWAGCGVDLNHWAADQARNEGLDVMGVSLFDAELADDSFDAVTMMDLLEHVSNPVELIAEASRLTKPGGVLAVLTPDAASPVSRLLGARWPELQRVPEHLTLFSAQGLAALLERHGFDVIGWHWIGKQTTVLTLISDVSPVAPSIGRRLHKWSQNRRIGKRVYNLNPYTKFCLYARRRDAHTVAHPDATSLPSPLRLPRRKPDPSSVDDAIFEDLQVLSRARRLCDWMFEQYSPLVKGRVLEVGGGIGTFTERLLTGGANDVLVVEPESACADMLKQRFSSDTRVRVVEEILPDAPTLLAEPGTFDLALCQNVLEHIDDHFGAAKAMAAALAPGGHLVILVPAHPRLFGTLDQGYGHHRRYTRQLLRDVIEEAGLEVTYLASFNLLGVPGWWVKNRFPGRRVTGRALLTYELMLRAWRPLERRLNPRWGLSLVVHGRKPAGR